MRGVVKDIEVNTVGGVTPPNGRLMVIVPIEDQVSVEARISPRDVAFLHPGQRAMISTADIHTGSKTVWEYLVKPFNRAREALRER